MKRIALTALLAAAVLAAARGRSPADPEAARTAPAEAAHDGYLGSGNRQGSTGVRP
jgi:hypothetical protein